MKALDLLLDLTRHMEWADATVWRAVLKSPAAASDERLRKYLHHIHMVQYAFINVWQDQPYSGEAGKDFDLVALKDWGHEFHQLATSYWPTVNEEDLDRPTNMPWAKYLTKSLGRDPAGTTKGETIMQVAAHTTYHRGQVNARLRELGEEPPLVDFIAWLWFGKPTADWQAE
jgi:uncharacterized damage-inducible protein DinB